MNFISNDTISWWYEYDEYDFKILEKGKISFIVKIEAFFPVMKVVLLPFC